MIGAGKEKDEGTSNLSFGKMSAPAPRNNKFNAPYEKSDAKSGRPSLSELNKNSFKAGDHSPNLP